MEHHAFQQCPVRSRKRAAAARNRHLRFITDDAVSPADLNRAPLSVVYVPTSQLRDPGRKVRRYSKRHLTGLKVSTEKFGMLRPVLVNKGGTIIPGVAVWLVAWDRHAVSGEPGSEELRVRTESGSPFRMVRRQPPVEQRKRRGSSFPGWLSATT